MRIQLRTPHPNHATTYILAENSAYDDRLPSREAIMGVADIYARLATDPEDRLVACILAVFTASGLRMGEVLTLAADCLVTEGEGDARRWGIRFSKEKSAQRKRVLETRWLTPAQAVLVRAAIAEALQLTQAPRDRALILEDYPETVPIPEVAWNAALTSNQVVDILAIRNVHGGAPVGLPRRRVPAEGKNYHLVFQAGDVMDYLHDMRGPLWVVNRGDGTHQMLTETLFITFKNYFTKRHRTNTLLVDHVHDSVVERFLRGTSRNPGVPSAFERFDIRERDARIVRLTSHGFRHWVTNQAAVGGVDDTLLARWQNRESTKDLRAYKHLSPTDKVAVVRDALKRGQLRGRLAEMYFALHDDIRDVFLEAHLQAVHSTPFGLCVHDFKVSPCPLHVNCLKRCGDYLHDTANAEERRTLIQLEEKTELALDQAKRQRALGQADLSEHWVAAAEDTLAGVRAVLAARPASETTVVRPFAGNESRFKPLGTD